MKKDPKLSYSYNPYRTPLKTTGFYQEQGGYGAPNLTSYAKNPAEVNIPLLLEELQSGAEGFAKEFGDLNKAKAYAEHQKNFNNLQQQIQKLNFNRIRPSEEDINNLIMRQQEEQKRLGPNRRGIKPFAARSYSSENIQTEPFITKVPIHSADDYNNTWNRTGYLYGNTNLSKAPINSRVDALNRNMDKWRNETDFLNRQKKQRDAERLVQEQEAERQKTERLNFLQKKLGVNTEFGPSDIIEKTIPFIPQRRNSITGRQSGVNAPVGQSRAQQLAAHDQAIKEQVNAYRNDRVQQWQIEEANRQREAEFNNQLERNTLLEQQEAERLEQEFPNQELQEKQSIFKSRLGEALRKEIEQKQEQEAKEYKGYDDWYNKEVQNNEKLYHSLFDYTRSGVLRNPGMTNEAFSNTLESTKSKRAYPGAYFSKENFLKAESKRKAFEQKEEVKRKPMFKELANALKQKKEEIVKQEAAKLAEPEDSEEVTIYKNLARAYNKDQAEFRKIREEMEANKSKYQYSDTVIKLHNEKGKALNDQRKKLLETKHKLQAKGAKL